MERALILVYPHCGRRGHGLMKRVGAGLKPFREHGVAPYHAVIANGYTYGFFTSDENDEIFSSCHRSIYKVSLEEGIMGGVQRNNDARKFRTLRFMHSDGIGQNNLPQVCGLIENSPSLKNNFHAFFLAVY